MITMAARSAAAWRVAGKLGPLPEGLSFSHGKDYMGRDVVDAHHEDKHVGQLIWRNEDGWGITPGGNDHPLDYITVHPEYRRRGVGTAMLNHIRDNIDPQISHSRNVTPSGMGFAKSDKFKPPPYASGDKGTFVKDPVRDDSMEWPDAAVGNGMKWDESFWRGKSKDRFAATDQDYGLPPSMEFRLYDGPGMYGLNAAGIWHKNKPTKGGNWVSAITWKNGEIGNIETKERHKGNGYAGMLHQWVKDNHEPNLQHSRSLTPEGRAWAEKVGAAPHMHMPTDEAVQYAHWGLEPENESDYPDLYAHVRQHGVQTPLTIATDGVNAYLQDGYHRLDAAQKAGHPTVPVNIEHIHHADESESVPQGPHLKNWWHSRTATMVQRAVDAWRLSGRT